jgi:hypothetical protein
VVGLLVKWPESTFKELDEAKRVAAERGDAQPIERLGFTAYVEGHGRSGKKGAPSMTWLLEVCGMRIGMQRVAEPRGDNANVRVNIGSRVLLELDGLARAYDLVKCIIEGLGGRVERNQLSRVDMCVDVNEDLITPLAEAIKEDRLICRAQDGAAYWKRRGGGLMTTGVVVGRGGTIMMRAYRKDVEARHKPELLELVCEKHLGIPGDVLAEAVPIISRIEFQLRRELLKELGAGSVEEYLERRAAIWKYLTEKWIRVADGEVDRTHTSRKEVGSWWSGVCEAGGRAFGTAAVAVARVVRRVHDAEARLAQAAGNLVTALVDMGVWVGDGVDLVENALAVAGDWMERKAMVLLEKFLVRERRAEDRIPRIVEFQ